MLKPLGNRVIIEVAKEEEQTVGGLVLPSSAKEKSQTGTVIAIGDGRVTDNGTKIDMVVKEGDSVLFEKYSGTDIKYEGKDYLVVKETDIVAIIG
ncbi:co-chaperone GroES [Jeotgalibaca ciconiae]|uniref:Co-chaperonin GroES n=1 Tax=Jeotgalibaca ciconiae TaxID=2496265 RepID=A0A3Q9BKN5_9LACT|nr:co-chaperone GroES [Jeotgalibaca ciconiae]AZP04567.1 co-chaperone GroES [Jeotgalibaca ciconiae]HJB24978.1 co-chaperone GroES [Candidatus Jeotgalibaca pullicola]